MKTLGIRIVTPDTPGISVNEAVSVVVPSVSGTFGVMADHAPMTAAVGAGILRYTTESGKWHYIVVGDGVAEAERSRVLLSVTFAREARDEVHAEEILEGISQTF